MPGQLVTGTPFVLLTASLFALGAQLLLAGSATNISYEVVTGRVADTQGSSYGDGTDSYCGIHLVGSRTEYLTPKTAVVLLKPGDEVTLWVGHNDEVQEVRISSGQSSGKLFTTESFAVTSSHLASTDAIRVLAGAVSLALAAIALWFWLAAGNWRSPNIRSMAALRWHEIAVVHPARSTAQLAIGLVVAGLVSWPFGLVLYGIVTASGGFGPTGPSFPFGAVDLSYALPDRAALLGLAGALVGAWSLGIGPRTGTAYWALWLGLLLAAAVGAFLLISIPFGA